MLSVNISVWMPKWCLLCSAVAYGVGNGADAQLQRGAVGNLLGNEAANPGADFINLLGRQAHHGRVVFPERIHLGNMDLRGGQAPGHMGVDLQQHRLGRGKQCRGQRAVAPVEK